MREKTQPQINYGPTKMYYVEKQLVKPKINWELSN